MAKILIADDSVVVRKFLKELLAQHGWLVCGEAKDGAQAVKLAEELHPDIVILDLSMPVMTGLAAAKKILTSAPEVPTVILTLHDSPELAREAAKVGVRKVISKALASSSLIAEIENLIGAAPVPLGVARLPLDLSAVIAVVDPAASASNAITGELGSIDLAAPEIPLIDPASAAPGITAAPDGSAAPEPQSKPPHDPSAS